MTEGADAGEQASGGSQRREVTARLVVPEMDCPSCAKKVDTSLQRVDGVVDATLQPTTGTATVVYDPDRTTEADVVEAIEAAGYEVVGGADADEEQSHDGVAIAPPSEIWTSPRAKKTWIGAVFLTLGLLFEFLLT